MRSPSPPLTRRSFSSVFGILLIPCAVACDKATLPDERVVPASTDLETSARTSALQAGPQEPSVARANPVAGNVHAIQEGARLFKWFNCADCHGVLGGGGMGVPLADGQWVYGEHPEQIRASIVQGRPNGMPSYGGKIPEDDLWKIVAFVSSLPEKWKEHKRALE